MSRKRVAHLITGLTVGGAEMMLHKLVSKTNREEFESIVITLWDGGAVTSSIQEVGVPVYSLGLRRGTMDLRGVTRLIRLLRQMRPALLQTWMYHANLLGAVAARPAGVGRLVWNLRTSNFVGHDRSRQLRWVSRLCAVLSGTPLRPDAIVTNAWTGMRAHMALGYRSENWHVIPNGFETDRFRPDERARTSVRGELGLPPDAFLVGHLARLDAMKDHGTLLRAVRLIRERYPSVRFLLAGRGVETLRSAELESVGVFFLGERADTPRLLAALDVFVSSSAYGEGFSNVIGEAMACAVPCVVTDVGDSATIVGPTGKVVPPGDATGLAEATCALLALPGQERAWLGVSAQRRVQDLYGLPMVVAQYERLYQSLIAD